MSELPAQGIYINKRLCEAQAPSEHPSPTPNPSSAGLHTQAITFNITKTAWDGGVYWFR